MGSTTIYPDAEAEMQPLDLVSPDLERAIAAYESGRGSAASAAAATYAASLDAAHAGPHAALAAYRSRGAPPEERPTWAGAQLQRTASAGARHGQSRPAAFFSASYGGMLGGAAGLHPRLSPHELEALAAATNPFDEMLKRRAMGEELLHTSCTTMATELPHGATAAADGGGAEPSPHSSALGARQWERGLTKTALRGSMSSGGLSHRARGGPPPPADPVSQAQWLAAERPTLRLSGRGPASGQVIAAAALGEAELRLMHARQQGAMVAPTGSARGSSTRALSRAPVAPRFDGSSIGASPTRFQRKSEDLGMSSSRPRMSSALSRAVSTGAFSRSSSTAALGHAEIKRLCPTCGFRWLDKYRKDEW